MNRRTALLIAAAALAAALAAGVMPTRARAGQLLYTASQYDKIYNEKVALELELDSLKRQYGNDKANMEEKIRELNAKIDSLNAEIEDLRKQQESERDQAAKRIKELQDMTEVLKKKGSDREKQLIDENRKLQARCEDDLTKLRDELAAEREKHRKEVDDLKAGYERKVADLQREIAALRDQLSELKKLSDKQKEELSRLEDQANELEKQLADEIKKGEIKLKRFHDKLIINIDDRISFDSGKADLKEGVMPALQKITTILGNYPEYRIVIEGHTDNVPISTSRFRDNWQLSTERALSVLGYILREKKLNSSRFSAAGYGEYNPIVPNDTPANRALNRRVDIVVVPRLTGTK
jgi:chemotaxis protein MotB